jgi:hypothetical protein
VSQRQKGLGFTGCGKIRFGRDFEGAFEPDHDFGYAANA